MGLSAKQSALGLFCLILFGVITMKFFAVDGTVEKIQTSIPIRVPNKIEQPIPGNIHYLIQNSEKKKSSEDSILFILFRI